MDIALERLTQRSLDPITGNRFHKHDQPAPNQHVNQRLTYHPSDEDEIVQKRYQTYTAYFDDLQDFYSQQDAIHVPADQDSYTVFEAIEAGIVNPLNKEDN